MEAFARIEKRAVKNVGGAAELEKLLPKPKSPRTIARLSDARCLAAIARSIFCTGFQPRIVENMWAGIEDAFSGFDPLKVARISDAQLNGMLEDTRVVRHEGKLAAVRGAARFVVKEAAQHGGFGKLVSRWPTAEIVGLWDVLRRGARWLGWTSSAVALANLGKDTFVLGRAAVTALIDQRVLAKPPTARRDLAAAQDAFNTWSAQTGRPLCQLSKILALS
jgi:3-methyladenine DNA glycosylase Tag